LTLLSVAITASVVLAVWPRTQEWTTDSPSALRAFQRGLEADMKYYKKEAVQHYAKALSHDPEFAIAKLKLLDNTYKQDDPETETLVQSLRATDLERLRPREAFLVRYALARIDRRMDRAQALLSEYLHDHPDDPFAIEMSCAQAWDQDDWEQAERSFRRLLQADPNWVSAQNHLGYIAMARGRFREAEELFRTYLFIAPDQANPHDSIGELLTLVGRYDQAEQELQEALRIKPDFCASAMHLVELHLFRGDLVAAETAAGAAAVERGCTSEQVAILRCHLQLKRAAAAGDWEGVWRSGSSGCARKSGRLKLMVHRAALVLGREPEAIEVERELKADLEKMAKHANYSSGAIAGLLLHLEGARLAWQGQYPAAIAKFKAADHKLVYWGDSQGLFKLLNRVNLARAQELAGERPAAHATLAEVAAVNPALARQAEQGRVAGLLWPARRASDRSS
jgi:Flp pilus assembly protein TadD